MPHGPDKPARPDDAAATGIPAQPGEDAGLNDYDSFAAAYTAGADADIQNAYYERPAILALAGDVTGRRILDADCGAGPLFAALRDRGAVMTGFDASAGSCSPTPSACSLPARVSCSSSGRPASRAGRTRGRWPGRAAARPGR